MLAGHVVLEFGSERAAIVAVEHAHRGGNHLLGTHTSDEADVEFPVKSLRGKDRFYGMADLSDVALLLLRLLSELLIVWEITEGPDDDGGAEDDATHLLEILAPLLPSVSSDGLPRRESVGRQLHDERRVLTLEDEGGEDLAHHDGQ